MGFALHRTGSAHGQPSVYHHEWVWHLHGTGEQEGIGELTGVSFIPQRTLNLELWNVKIGSSSELEFFKTPILQDPRYEIRYSCLQERKPHWYMTYTIAIN